MPAIIPKRIGPGVLIPYLTALFFVVGIGILAIVRLGQISDTVNHVVDNLATEQALADDIVNQALLVRSNANSYVRTQLQADLDQFDASFAQLEALLHQASQQIVDPDRSAELALIDAAVQQYGVAFGEVVQLIQARQQIQAGQARLTELFAASLDRLEPEISRTAGEIAASVESEFEQQNHLSQSLIVQTRFVLLVATTLAVLAGIGLGVVLFRSLAEQERAESSLDGKPPSANKCSAKSQSGGGTWKECCGLLPTPL